MKQRISWKIIDTTNVIYLITFIKNNSMHAFSAETNQIVDHLQEAYTKIETIHNPDMEWLKNKILLDIKRHIDALKLQLGQEPTPGPVIEHQPGPIKKLFGKDVTVPAIRPPADVNKPFQQTPADVELAELQLKIGELWPRFLSTSSDHLMDSVTDIEIRAVAKKAGMPVTETNPKRITTAYIDQIKRAIQQQLRSTNDDTVMELVRSRETLYNEFSSIEIKDIPELYSEQEIREVARMAGLPVTETNPAKIDNKFLGQIKTAIKKKAQAETAEANV